MFLLVGHKVGFCGRDGIRVAISFVYDGLQTVLVSEFSLQSLIILMSLH